MGKFMKSENEYLRIEKNLKHSNLKAQRLEQDLEKAKFQPKTNFPDQSTFTVTFRNNKKGHQKIFVCHFCGIQGHIRPYCYKLLKNYRYGPQERHSQNGSRKLHNRFDSHHTPLRFHKNEHSNPVMNNNLSFRGT